MFSWESIETSVHNGNLPVLGFRSKLCSHIQVTEHIQSSKEES